MAFLLDDIAALMSYLGGSSSTAAGTAGAAGSAGAGATAAGGTAGTLAGSAGSSGTLAGAAGAGSNSIGSMGDLMSGVSGSSSAAYAPTSQAPSGIGGAINSISPNAYEMGNNLAKGNFQQAGANLGGMVGGDNLKSFINYPSMQTAAPLAKGAGTQMRGNMYESALNSMFRAKPNNPVPLPGGGSKAPQQSQQSTQQVSTNPILQQMYQNLNPQQQPAGNVQQMPYQPTGPGLNKNKVTPGFLGR